MVKVSVVLPIYNVAKYLPKCLETLCAQTLQDIEIVCVDDGSTDNTPDILARFAQEDRRIRIFRQSNAGPGAARNYGIEAAQGEYIGFVDPDDWPDVAMFEKMYAEAVKYDADVVECGVMVHLANSKRTICRQAFSEHFVDMAKYPEYIFGGISAAWNKLCKATLLRDKRIRFSLGRCCEDFMFTLSLRLRAKKIVCLDEPLYHYLTHKGSLTRHKSAYNLEVPVFLGDAYKALREAGVYSAVEERFENVAASLALTHFEKTPHADRLEYYQRCKEHLPEKSFELVDKMARPYAFREKIFSVRNRVKGAINYKVVTIFGISFRFKQPKLFRK